MERKLTKDEFVQLFRLQRQRTKRASDIDRQDKNKEYNDFYTIAYGTSKFVM